MTDDNRAEAAARNAAPLTDEQFETRAQEIEGWCQGGIENGELEGTVDDANIILGFVADARWHRAELAKARETPINALIAQALGWRVWPDPRPGKEQVWFQERDGPTTGYIEAQIVPDYVAEIKITATELAKARAEIERLKEAVKSALNVGEIKFGTNALARDVGDKLRAALAPEEGKG